VRTLGGVADEWLPKDGFAISTEVVRRVFAV